MKPVSFVEFEQKPQKVDGVTRDILNNAIKSLNAVFRKKEEAKEALVLSQTQVDTLFNEDNDLRLGTKIILMLLKFKRIDCRSAHGQSYFRPFPKLMIPFWTLQTTTSSRRRDLLFHSAWIR